LDQDYPNRFEQDDPYVHTLISGKSNLTENAIELRERLREIHGDKYFQALQEIGTTSSINVRLKGHESVLGMITFFTSKDSTKRITKRHIHLAEELAYRAAMAFENALAHQSSIEAIRARDEFLSIASHELKTPLQSLTLQNQMRKRNLNKNLLEAFTPDKVSRMIEADLKHLMRINRLIDDMLDISRIRAGKLNFMKETADISTFVNEVLERFGPQLDAVGCFLTITIKDEMKANFDIYRLEQVLLNVLTNAMKYGSGRPISVVVQKKSDKALISVHDQGPGINSEDLERIFDRFERAISSSEVSGLGLGLYISRQIMEQHNGALYATSVIGKGSTFTLELPITT
jgi:signal transduction histidine kinase